MTERSDWVAVFSAFALGVAGAVQVGRIAPVAPFIQQDLQIDLFTLGWLVSLITLASAVFGLFAGYWVIRVGLRVSLGIGGVLICTCAALAAFATSVPMLVGLRIVEGVGYLVVVVAAPTLIAREAAPKDIPFALALWGTFFTLGLGIAAFAGGAISELVGWRGWFLFSAGLVFAISLAAFLLTPRAEPVSEKQSGIWTTISDMPVASWLLGAGFLGVTLLGLAILSVLPTFLVETQGYTPAAAGGATGGIALASIAGSLSYGGLARRWSDLIIAWGAATVLVVAVFPAFASAAGQVQIIICAAIAVFISGILVAQTFAAVPGIAGRPDLIGPSNGLIAQLGSIGALSGPPLVGAFVGATDWRSVSMISAGFALSFVVLFTWAMMANSGAAKKA
ncbi:MAG: CynX/NimT family MFS transporter [Paracoccaceae bacterium]